MFSLPVFTATLKLDNPTYERVRTSDLHALVAKLSSGGFSSSEVAAEMKKISGEKWRKYGRTRAYLLGEIPGLGVLVKPGLINFKTQSMAALPGGNIKHDAVWESDTGSLQDLTGFFVREKVMWGAASPQAANFLDPAYRVPGHHYGVGNAAMSAGSVGNMSDTHDAKGAWAPAVFGFRGPGSISYRCTQVYQYTDDDKATWKDIPNSTYEIVRSATSSGAKLKLEIVKRTIPPNTRHETRSNALLA